MRIAVTGATGFIGGHLCRRLRREGGRLALLARRPDRLEGVQSEDRVERWDGVLGPPPSAFFEGVEAVVHLAGAGIAERRWTKSRKDLIARSRVDSTRHLVEAMSRPGRTPRVLVSGSAIGIYGDRGDEELTEASEPGTGFLASTAVGWEAAARPLEAAGSRVVLLRTGIVLSLRGGALPEMARPVRFFVGGPLGHGRQFQSWIHLRDTIGLILEALQNEEINGPVNAVAPSPVRQRELVSALGNILRRPAFIPTPGWVLRLALGEMAGPLLLASQRVRPDAALAAGFDFQFPGLTEALADIFSEE